MTDPLDPVHLGAIRNPLIQHHHGSAFSSDGDTLVIADENVHNLVAGRCSGGTGTTEGALWFYDVSQPSLPKLQGFYQLPQSVSTGWCTVHQFNIVPMDRDRDVLVAGWYRGGTTVVDFTDPSDPRQLAYYVALSEGPNRLSAAWSSYWYNGFVYSNNLNSPSYTMLSERGLDVFAVEHPLLEDFKRMDSFNFGTQ